MKFALALLLLASPAVAEPLFDTLGCAACHPGLPSDTPPTAAQSAPDLRFEGQRVKRVWLEAYLSAPTVIRPTGHPVGSGARMPPIKLSPAQVQALTDALMKLRDGPPTKPAPSKPLTTFSAKKAERLIRDKLSCLGCHRLGDEGGRVGPDLSSLSSRLQPDYVYALLQDPQAWMPDTPMPKQRWRGADLDLVVRYLTQQELPRSAELLTVKPETSSPSADYQRFCSMCHGPAGNGQGFNAKFLPSPPTNHTDAALAKRPDDSIYDVIHSGGAVLGKTPRMPAFGQILGPKRIRALVKHLRGLCDCAGPRWNVP